MIPTIILVALKVMKKRKCNETSEHEINREKIYEQHDIELHDKPSGYDNVNDSQNFDGESKVFLWFW